MPSDAEVVIWNRAAMENGGANPGPGAGDVAKLVEGVEHLLAAEADDEIEQANGRYDELIPTDSRLLDLVVARMREAPGDFAPV